MAQRNFRQLLEAKWEQGKFVCLGLDPLLNRIPDTVGGRTPGERVYNFFAPIIEANVETAGCFKPQMAYFERLRGECMDTLLRVVEFVHRCDPTVPIILDAKRGDIGSTNEGYTETYFDWLGVDAVTISPYLGMKANPPFLDRANIGVIVLCRTSNDGSDEFQNRRMEITPAEAEQWGLSEGTTIPQYELVARRVATYWNANGNCALVVGATYPTELAVVRQIVGDDMPLLIPGIGAQGGSILDTVRAARGRSMIINNSRGINYAYERYSDLGPKQFAEASVRATREMHDKITAALAAMRG
jgi:orotidine-5'-phosphate decarboxylase